MVPSRAVLASLAGPLLALVGCQANANVLQANHVQPSASGSYGTGHTVTPTAVPSRQQTHWRFTGRKQSGCIVRGSLTIFEFSSPNRICLRNRASLHVLWSAPAGVGQWTTPSTTTPVATIRAIQRSDSSVRAVLKGRSVGQTTLTASTTRPEGSTGTVSITVRVKAGSSNRAQSK